MNKRPILKLNKYYLTCGIADWREVVKNIFTNAVFPLDLHFGTDCENNLDLSTLDSMELIKNWEDWSALPVRDHDEWINSASGRIRLPSVVVCADYKKVPFVRAKFPTKRNIWERDNYTCGYTNEVLTKRDLTVDHIVPRAKGGTNTWENLITCKRLVNHVKGDHDLAEAKFPLDRGKYGKWAGKNIKLKLKPTKPKEGRDQIVFDNWREEWYTFTSK